LNLAQMLESASEALAKLTEHHRLEMEVPPRLPTVYINQDSILQVLTNLVDNAVKFSPQDTRLTIEAKAGDEDVTVSVTDEGQGIAPELLERVFDRFYQAESIVSGRKTGTGLGLSICKGIIEAHGGRIWAESKPGEGSRFSFTVPVSKGVNE